MIGTKISIIIPHRNQSAQLQKCLDRLIELGYGRQEIIVVDNGSTIFPEFLSRYPVTTLQTEVRPSPYIARNLGISNANYDIIALLDVNAIVEYEWLENALKILQEGMILGGIVARPDPATINVFQRFDYLHSVIYPDRHGQIRALPAGNLFFYKKTWDAVGPFREIRSLGDMEWSIRARKQGVELIVNPGVRYHYPFKSGNAFTAKYRRLGKGHAENGFHQYRWWYVVKNMLPPSPGFVKNMQARNRKQKMRLNRLQIFFLCYWVKINYALGYVEYSLSRDSRSN